MRTMSRPVKAPSPPKTIDPSAIVSAAASLTGVFPITIGANSIVHPRARLTSLCGPITIGEGCMISEKAVVGLQSKEASDGNNGVVLGNGVSVESAARVEGRVEVFSLGDFPCLE